MQPPARCSNHRCVYIDQCDSTVEKYVVVIVDIEKIQKVKVNRENDSFVDIKVRLMDFFYYQELEQ